MKLIRFNEIKTLFIEGFNFLHLSQHVYSCRFFRLIRYLLFKHPKKWSSEQARRAELLFTLYPLLQRAYALATELGVIYRTSTCKEQAFKKLALWYNEVEAAGIESFKTVARSIQTHYRDILNFFLNRSTNASAESFNAKVKAFRATQRGVRDVDFFLFRLAKIYA